MFKNTRFWRRLLAMGIATIILAHFGTSIYAQDDAAEATRAQHRQALTPNSCLARSCL